MYLTDDYYYTLPPELIAQAPLPERDQSKLMMLQRRSGAISHHSFFEISDLLTENDLLVFNDTKVIPARLFGKKKTGGKVEVLVLDYDDHVAKANKSDIIIFQCLVKSTKPPAPDTEIFFAKEIWARVIAGAHGIYQLEFHFKEPVQEIFNTIGVPPLPPYIKRTYTENNGNENINQSDYSRYQTVYAKHQGAIAAPTAGLHFTSPLLKKLEQKNIASTFITLHVGQGTFSPVRVKDIRDHHIHTERFFISSASAKKINNAKSSGMRIIAVGTTSVRALEFAADDQKRIRPGAGECDLFIIPGFPFKIVDGIITNFHLPQSTLLMLVSAFCGHESIMAAYKRAIKNKYRFYSYGDAMIIH